MYKECIYRLFYTRPDKNIWNSYLFSSKQKKFIMNHSMNVSSVVTSQNKHFFVLSGRSKMIKGMIHLHNHYLRHFSRIVMITQILIDMSNCQNSNLWKLHSSWTIQNQPGNKCTRCGISHNNDSEILTEFEPMYKPKVA